MTKFIIFITKVAVTIITAVLLTSCRFSDIDLGNGVDGNGNVKTENRTITDKFTKVKCNRGLNVEIEQAPSTEIQVEADENLLKLISTTVENGTLIVTTNESIDSAQKLVVRVKMPIIEGIEATSGSRLEANKTLKGESIKVESSSGSTIEANLEYDSITSDSSSGSSITLYGKALKMNTNSSSGSSIDADELIANEIYSESTSGSTTDVKPAVLLNAKASSGSSIDYSGDPKTVKKDESSGGSVNKI